MAAVTSIAEYADPRIVALYDTLNPFADDTTFYLDLAERLSATVIADLGCGTGLLAVELAQRGCAVIGVDPAPKMLDVARCRDGGEQVRWIEGDAGQLGEIGADLVVMSGHVPQVIVDDDAWRATLTAIHTALRPGGRVAFESRNPQARGWEAWTSANSRRRVNDPLLGPVDVAIQLLGVQADLVSFEIRYLFAVSGDEVVSSGRLRYRSQDELSTALAEAGFAVENVYGNWDLRPAGPAEPELIFVAVHG
jgi:SAM-dependent methyltransferase